MASIFTYQEEPPRIQSPWSTPGTNTPRIDNAPSTASSGAVQPAVITKLEPERQDGPTEYKLHLLLRPRRKFLSISTTDAISGSFHSRPDVLVPASRSSSDVLLQRMVSPPSNHIRQTRLQQLTTQLLWRLQQSSPFHSSSNAELVLPLLPERVPRSSVPVCPAKLLPGLEESQGALYEIGVADDGTLVGLTDDELDESLNNLRAMAGSLGCVVEILRKVLVGNCRWVDGDTDSAAGQLYASSLWVAEVLVRPDSKAALSGSKLLPLDAGGPIIGQPVSPAFDPTHDHAQTQQLRVTLIGATFSGKSSLLGMLSTSVLDNGRGKSRLSLLRHRHELASGITSSVAHELVGYAPATPNRIAVVNYASDNVSAWTDIHTLATRLVFLSDSPGAPRFAKSTLRALISWKPQWTVLCIAANEGEDRVESTGDTITPERQLSTAHLHLCLKLNLPLSVVVTKMDLATRSGLRAVLARLLSALKQAGRKPALLSTTPVFPSSTVTESAENASNVQCVTEADLGEIDRVFSALDPDQLVNVVPILMTSAATGVGMSKVHALLYRLPYLYGNPAVHRLIETDFEDHRTRSPLFYIDEVFGIPPSKVYSSSGIGRSPTCGIVLCGHVHSGTLTIGDEMRIGPFIFEDENIGAELSSSLADTKMMAGMIRRGSKSTSGLLARSLSSSRSVPRIGPPRSACGFIPVRVVSVRNLRLPVRSLCAGETGTIGVEPIESDGFSSQLSRARKGMILTNHTDDLVAYQGITVTFDTADFPLTSSPLILGGHTTIYVNNIRTTAKVTAMVLDEGVSNTPQRPNSAATSRTPTDVFNFDNDDDNYIGRDGHDVTSSTQEDDSASTTSSTTTTSSTSSETRVKISFRFVNTVEWLEIGDHVLVVPNSIVSNSNFTGPSGGTSRSLGASSPPVVVERNNLSGNATVGGGHSGNFSSNITSLSGFVGIVCDLITS